MSKITLQFNDDSELNKWHKVADELAAALDKLNAVYRSEQDELGFLQKLYPI